MIFEKPSFIRSFCSCSSWLKWSSRIGFGIPGARAALLLLSALPLSSHAQLLPIQITVNTLPYVLTNQGPISYNGIIIHNSYNGAPSVKAIPQQVGMSTFGSLFGGGFSALNSFLPGTSGGAAAAATVIGLRQVAIIKAASGFQQKAVQQLNQDATDAINKARANFDSGCSDDAANLARFSGTKTGPMPNPPRARVVSNRIKALRMRHALPLLATADTCELPQEQEAEDAEAELDALTESEAASEDAVEAAEVAAEVAETAAEAAEVATEASLEAVEILETVLEACSLF